MRAGEASSWLVCLEGGASRSFDWGFGDALRLAVNPGVGDRRAHSRRLGGVAGREMLIKRQHGDLVPSVFEEM